MPETHRPHDDISEKILEQYHHKGVAHLKSVVGFDSSHGKDETVFVRGHMDGPILIIDECGTYPENLDEIIQQQAEYYRKTK